MRICAAWVESAFAWRRATGERETRWLATSVRAVADRVANYVRAGRSAMRICAALAGSVFAWRRVTGERETGWRKRGVSLVSGMICGIRSVPKACPARASYKSDPQECPTRSVPDRVSHKSSLTRSHL